MPNNKTHRVSMENVVFKADKTNPSVLTIDSGDTVVFDTESVVRSGEITAIN